MTHRVEIAAIVVGLIGVLAFFGLRSHPSPVAAPAPPLVAHASHAPYPHLPFGNVSDAGPGDPDNLLVQEPHFALSFNQSKGTPNWVSWRLTVADLGTAARAPTFQLDSLLPASIRQPHPTAYHGSGFDLGHVCPHADRASSKEASYATFVMSNVMPQAPKLNRVAWEHHESHIRQRVQAGATASIVAGPAGKGGIGEHGAAGEIKGVTVPAWCWKVVRYTPGGDADECVIMPNRQDVHPDWAEHTATVGEIETLTGFKFTIPKGTP